MPVYAQGFINGRVSQSRICLWLKRLSLSFSVILLSSCFVAADGLPQLPEQEERPFADTRHKSLAGAKALGEMFDAQGYKLDSVKQGAGVPPLFGLNLPKDLNNQPVTEKISEFIRLLLPNVLAVNQQITRVRQQLEVLVKIPVSQRTAAENEWLQELLTHYSIAPQLTSDNLNQLLMQLDVIPVGMVLAQGIDESGWGTSHFAIAGNALYGEHNPKGSSHYLTTPGGHVKVAAFDSMFEGTAAYMFNLNTAKAYQGLWQLRQTLKREHRLTGYELVTSLEHYSTRGNAYVENLQSLITHHQLDAFGGATLTDDTPTTLTFSR
ncbi:glucosaminidase domain-containing protein [Shewanella corallii]|uniref:Glucosaminidase domain-containing protein n=1 Tax=Shewanella corallii TaxID=560080 RepID=A0ABT0N2B9_9GAMM|nr:glucosaminidase domain-containing protein [Shewanella corallii]MCL2912574.1 glucosaminidase domain-containing protein [Shewanella corallii]